MVRGGVEPPTFRFSGTRVPAGHSPNPAPSCDAHATSVLHHDRPRKLRRISVSRQFGQRRGYLGVTAIHRYPAVDSPRDHQLQHIGQARRADHRRSRPTAAELRDTGQRSQPRHPARTRTSLGLAHHRHGSPSGASEDVARRPAARDAGQASKPSARPMPSTSTTRLGSNWCASCVVLASAITYGADHRLEIDWLSGDLPDMMRV